MKTVILLALFIVSSMSASSSTALAGTPSEALSACTSFLLEKDSLQKLIREHGITQLEETWGQRGGVQRRAVWLLSGHPKKMSEVREIFSKYGIEVLWAPVNLNEDYFQMLLQFRYPNVKVLSVLAEQTQLISGNLDLSTSAQISAAEAAGVLKDKQTAVNTATLRIWSLKDGALALTQYRDQVEVDFYKKPPIQQPQTPHEAVFNWDNRVVPTQLGAQPGLTYHALAKKGFKVSARDHVFSAYLNDLVYYPSSKKHSHQDLPQFERPVSFQVDPVEVASRNPLLFNVEAERAGIADLFRRSFNGGLFFQASQTRRQGNYFAPGFNAGIPLVSKPDPHHETTYFAHDLGHFLMPDLAYSGDGSALHQKTYLVHRMLGEAITMMIADGVFVDTLKRSGFQYDYSKRLIDPLVEASGLRFDEGPKQVLKNIFPLLKANTEFVITGKVSRFKELLSHRSDRDHLLKRFHFYDRFFTADLKWNLENFKSLQIKSKQLEQWREIVTPIAKMHGVDFVTLDDRIQELSLTDEMSAMEIADRMLEHWYRTVMVPAFEQKVKFEPRPILLKRAFVRYMIGQLSIFSVYGEVDRESKRFETQIVGQLLSLGQSITFDEVQAIRSLYDNYIAHLKKINLISPDDAAHFRENYPLFSPRYVSYNEFFGDDFAAYSRRVFEGVEGPAYLEIPGSYSPLMVFKSQIDRHLDRDHQQLTQENKNELASALNRENLVAILREVIDTPDLLTQIAARSYIHSLGFQKISLFEDWNGREYALRLHVWWPQEAGRNSVAITDGKLEHNWDFVSRLITRGTDHAHRLFISPDHFASTFILTGSPHEVREETEQLPRRFFTPEELRSELIRYLEAMGKTGDFL